MSTLITKSFDYFLGLRSKQAFTGYRDVKDGNKYSKSEKKSVLRRRMHKELITFAYDARLDISRGLKTSQQRRFRSLNDQAKYDLGRVLHCPCAEKFNILHWWEGWSQKFCQSVEVSTHCQTRLKSAKVLLCMNG